MQQGRCGTEAAIIRYQMVTIHYEEIGDDPSLPGILCTTTALHLIHSSLSFPRFKLKLSTQFSDGPTREDRKRMNTRDVLLFKLTLLLSDSRKALISQYPAMGHPGKYFV